MLRFRNVLEKNRLCFLRDLLRGERNNVCDKNEVDGIESNLQELDCFAMNLDRWNADDSNLGEFVWALQCYMANEVP